MLYLLYVNSICGAAMKTLILLLCLISVNVHASPLTDMQVKKEVAWQVINLIDYGQTMDIAKSNGTYNELNPILGTHPTTQAVERYFFISAISHYAITKYLTNHRDAWQNITIFVSASCVYNNYEIGLRVNF